MECQKRSESEALLEIGEVLRYAKDKMACSKPASVQSNKQE